ncbi:MAG: hydrolase, partial [Cyclobacteriaceae bacterium]|nr:hydrolase [Cyclobacteriaceae bacterium SS2]
TDKLFIFAYNFRTKRQHTFSAWTAYDFVELQFPFDPTNSGNQELPTGSQNTWTSWGTNFTSKPQSLFTYGFETRYGGYYQDGTRLNLTTDIGYRFQPYVNFSMMSSYNKINMMDPWGTSDFWLVGPRLDLTFTNNLYLTTFAQYNEQIDNININSRLQWRYAPASDLFIVYSDNYFPAPINVKNRSLVVKLTYWWNI